jgi:hypothetical protein
MSGPHMSNKGNYGGVYIHSLEQANSLAYLMDAVESVLETNDGYVLMGTSKETIDWLNAGSNRVDLILAIEAERSKRKGEALSADLLRVGMTGDLLTRVFSLEARISACEQQIAELRNK